MQVILEAATVMNEEAEVLETFSGETLALTLSLPDLQTGATTAQRADVQASFQSSDLKLFYHFC